MQQLYPKIDSADVIVFSTPNYWYGPSAKMKLLIDRIRPYVANKKLNGKKAVVITPAAEGPRARGPLIEMFQMSFDYLGIEFICKILAQAYEKGEIKGNEKKLEEAYELGASM